MQSFDTSHLFVCVETRDATVYTKRAHKKSLREVGNL